MTAIKKNWFAAFTILIYVGIAIWWLSFQSTAKAGGDMVNAYDAVYGVLALLGGIWGLIVARKWGGLKSKLGKAISFLSLGLLAQEFGQLAYYYTVNIKQSQNPYPSIGDVGYFGSVILYTLGVIYIAKVIGVQFSLRSLWSKVVAAVVPLIILAASYLTFLKGYNFDWSNPIKVILDFGYPLGEAFYISLALLSFLLSRKYLGGILRSRILFLLLALLIQYSSDFTFLYQSSNNTWYAGGINDFLYQTAYVVMALALYSLGSVYNKMKRA